MLVREYIEMLRKYGQSGNKVYFKSQEGKGDNVVLPIDEFINLYGDRQMGEGCSDDFCHADGTRNLNQYIKRLG